MPEKQKNLKSFQVLNLVVMTACHHVSIDWPLFCWSP